MKLDNSPARFDFPITLEGDTFRGWVMELKESGNPIDLTGAEVSLEVKARFYAGQQPEKPKKNINPGLVFFIGFIGFIIGLVVGAVIN